MIGTDDSAHELYVVMHLTVYSWLDTVAVDKRTTWRSQDCLGELVFAHGNKVHRDMSEGAASHRSVRPICFRPALNLTGVTRDPEEADHEMFGWWSPA